MTGNVGTETQGMMGHQVYKNPVVEDLWHVVL